MGNFTNKQIIEIYNKMGFNDPNFFSGKSIINLFKLLNIEPKFDENGKRILTPYEILGVLPQIVNNKEKPIVFAIKNRVTKIGKYEGNVIDFFYKKQKVKEEKTILQTLKEKYRAAIFAGDDALADKCLQMIGNLSDDELHEFKDSFYDYSKFYKKMKKQLLIDLFAHFFMQYIENISKVIKSGIIRKNKKYKSYYEKVKINSDVTFNSDMDVINVQEPPIDPIQFGLQNVKKLVINDKNFENLAVVDISDKEVKIKTRQTINQETNADASNQNIQSEDSKIGSNLMVSEIVQKSEMIDEKPETLDEKPEMMFQEHKSSFIKIKNKFLHKIGLNVETIDEQQSEQDKSYSKKDKINKEFEIEI